MKLKTVYDKPKKQKYNKKPQEISFNLIEPK